MARILPDEPLGPVTPEVLKLYRLFKQLRGEDYTVWHRLTLWKDPGPDFWLLHQNRGGMLLKVSSATSAEARVAGQFRLFALQKEAAELGMLELEALQTFHRRVAESDPATAVDWRSLPGIVVFPNLSEAEVRRIVPSSLPAGLHFTGKETLAPERFPDWIEANVGQPLPEQDLDAIRRTMAPEVKISPGFTVRKLIQRNTQAQLTDYLLDYDQEWVLKTDLDLSTAAGAAAGEFGLRLVNGVAGSGKSLIVLYRAHLLRQFYPDKDILVLTHNRPLIRDLAYRYLRLNGGGRPVEFKTFLSWCYSRWPASIPWRNPIGRARREAIITRVWHTHLAATSLSEQMLQEEIDWFKDRLLFTRQDYRAADRTGRGFALNESMRHRVFDAIEAYRQELDLKGAVDWSDVPRRLWQSLESGQASLPIYDFVLVDEAQFFAPIWFEILKAVVKPQTGHLFLVADPTQGFLKRRQSWQASGLEVRGKSHRLGRSYRTTREILDFATLLYRSRVPEDDEDIVAPDLLSMPGGAVPMIIPLTSTQDEITRVINEIREMVKAGVPLGHILVIHADWQGVDRLLARLRQEFGLLAAADPKDTATGNHIRVCTLNAATGLESPIVFLVGAHALYQEEQSVRLSDEERAELVRDNTRKLYMAITRAGQRLVLTYVGDTPEALRRLSGMVRPTAPAAAADS